jgi:hypothetical protein
MASLAMSWILSLFMFQSVPTGRFVGLYVGFFAAAVAVQMLCGFQFRMHPLACAILCLVLTVVGIAILIWAKEREVGLLIGWFFFIAITARGAEKNFREAGHPRNVTWHWRLIEVIVTLGIFGMYLYPKIPPRLGGGQPTRITLQFASVSPIDGKTKDDFWLLDEVDTGYYVLRAPDEHKAIFLPRALVSAIYFDSAAQH